MTADVVVIGGGVIGCAVARELAPVTAEALADLVLAGRTALPITGMSPARFGRAGRTRSDPRTRD